MLFILFTVLFQNKAQDVFVYIAVHVNILLVSFNRVFNYKTKYFYIELQILYMVNVLKF